MRKNTNHHKLNSAPSVSPLKLIVSETENETELLSFLLLKIKNKSRNNIKTFLSYGCVSVNNRIIKQFNTLLFTGDTVLVSTKPVKNEDNLLELPFKIIYEDDNIIAIDKPHGLLSIATDKEKENTAYHYLTEYVKTKNPDNRIYVIHRLDRDTSGVMIVAKTEAAKHSFQDNWEDIAVSRGYTAVIEGVPEEKSGVVHSWLLETKTHLVYSSDSKGDGLEAITEYDVTSSNEEFSLVELRIRTGRKNQIRVHMKDLGTPVTGDKKYGAQKNPLRRLALHAGLLEIKSPYTGEIMRFSVKTPNGFFNCTSKTQSKNSAFKR